MARQLTPRDIAEVGEAAWDAFVRDCPSASFFHLAGWRRVVADSYGHKAHYRCAVRDGRIVGVLPLIHLRAPLFGDALISTGFGVYGGIASVDAEATAALAADAAALGRALRVGYVELRHQRPVDLPGWATKSGVYATFRRALPGADMDTLRWVPQKRRTDLRRSMRMGLRVELGDVAAFHRIYAESLRNLGTPAPPRRFFEALLREFRDAVEVAVVHGPDGPVSATTSLYFRDSVTPHYSGARPAARRLHAYDFTYWELMRRARDRGSRVFDFGRSKFGTGAFDYKVWWGFEPEPLHYQYYLAKARSVPDINPLNPKYRAFVAAWRRLPLAAASAAGPILARQLG